MRFVLVPAGEFMMGNRLAATDEVAEFKKYGVDLTANLLGSSTHPTWCGSSGHSTSVRSTLHAASFGGSPTTRDSNRTLRKATIPEPTDLDPERGTLFGFQEGRSCETRLLSKQTITRS